MSLLLLFNRVWSPAYLASTKGWVKGDRLSGADLSDVTTWAAETGADAVSLGNNPQLRTAFLDNKNVVQSTPANVDVLTWVNVSSYTQGSVFYVAKSSSTGQTGLPTGRFGTAGASGEYYNQGGVSGVVWSSFLSTTDKTTGAVFGDTSIWHIAGFLSKANDWRIRRDGVDVYTTATNTVAGYAGASLVCASEGLVYFGGEIAEVVLFDEFLSAADQQRVEGYLAWKWGLEGSLDAGHTYKSAPPLQDVVSPISGAATITITPTGAVTGRGALSGASALTFTPAAILKGAGAFAGALTLTLTVTGAGILTAAASGATTFSFTPSGALTGRGALVGASTLTFAPAATVTGRGALLGSTSLTFAPTGAISGTAALNGASSLSFSPTGAIGGQGALSGASSPTFATAGTITGSGGAAGDITGTTGLTFAPAADISGEGELIGASTLGFTPTGTITGQGGGGVAQITGSTSFGFLLGGSISGATPFVIDPPPLSAPVSLPDSLTVLALIPPTALSLGAFTVEPTPGGVSVVAAAPPPQLVLMED